MELKSLYTVMKIVECGSYQKAAMALNYAPSTVTFQIKQLEAELGIKLFAKSGNRMALTAEAKAALPLIKNVITATDLLLAYAENGTPHGSLRIAMPETLATYKMQPVLTAFKEAAPNVKLSIQVMNCYAIHKALLEGKIDLAIHYDVKHYPQSIMTLELGNYPLVMVASPFLDDSLTDLTVNGRNLPVCHIRNDPNALYLNILDEYLKSKRISLESGIEVWSIEAVKKCVMSRLGIAYLPYFTVVDELSSGLLKKCKMDIEGNMTAICAYYKSREAEPSIKLFKSLLEKEFKS